MTVKAGVYELGPECGTLWIRTGRTGAVAKAGHDLLLHVTVWRARVEIGEDPSGSSISLEADPRSLRVIEGTGGMMPLGDDDRAGIVQTIDDEVLKGREVAFRSTSVGSTPGGDRLDVKGELTLAGATRTIALDVAVDGDGGFVGQTTVKQSDWGIKPYSALFGALKVADEIQLGIDCEAPPG
jgi:YceI-like domain